MTQKKENINRLIAELSGGIISVFEAASDRSNFAGCGNCRLNEHCDRHELYCGNAVLGLLVGQDWKPQEGSS